MATQTDTSNGANILDARDLIARVEELEATDPREEDEQDELDQLSALLAELRDNGGDEEWRGAWYPLTLIRESYFGEYAQELAEDIGAIGHDAPWPLHHIDWKAASEELQNDYTSVEYDGITYWCR